MLYRNVKRTRERDRQRERERERERARETEREREREMESESSVPRTDPPVKWRRSYKPHRCNDRLEDVFQSIWYGDGMDEYKPWKNAQAIAAMERFVRCMRAAEGYDECMIDDID